MKTVKIVRLVCLVLIAITLVPRPARADALDLGYFTWVDFFRHSTMNAGALVVLIMAVNYILNLIIIGVPAKKYGPKSFRAISIDMFWLTIVGQIADRLGALLALIVAMSIFNFNSTSMGWANLGFDFLFSGLSVGALALYFLRRHWLVAARPAWIIVGIAAVLTNPTWVLLILPPGGF